MTELEQIRQQLEEMKVEFEDYQEVNYHAPKGTWLVIKTTTWWL